VEFPEGRLLVFAKAPVPGQVKTRLAGKLGRIGAAKLYQRMLQQTLVTATSGRLCPVQLWCAPDTRHGFFKACRRAFGVSLHPQHGSDLGQRMQHALITVLRANPYVLLMGGDCLSLGVDELRFALAVLAAGQEAVLGPAADGGYLLLGLRRPHSALFRGIHWGSDQVLAATRRRLRRAGLTGVELPTGWDVDHPRDLRRLQRLSSRTNNPLK
jgi:rSAM/selenodomain-associated transferase 1